MMKTDPRKIAFITCVSDDAAYAECTSFIDALTVPAGYATQKIAVRQSPSMAAGCNEGMNRTNAKYKVYLHQDVLIVNREFVPETIRLFEDNPGIGLAGVVGAKYIPVSGVWWECPERVGKIYDSISGRLSLYDWEPQPSASYTEAEAIDGLIMVTQYDIRWREEWFTGWHYYDMSQCMEFIRAGYKVAVYGQQKPWCIHDCKIKELDRSYGLANEQFKQRYFTDRQ